MSVLSVMSVIKSKSSAAKSSSIKGLFHFGFVVVLAASLAGPGSGLSFAEDTHLKKAPSEKHFVVEKVTDEGLIPVETGPAQKKEGAFSRAFKKFKAFLHRPVLKANAAPEKRASDVSLAPATESNQIAVGSETGFEEGSQEGFVGNESDRHDPEEKTALNVERLGGSEFQAAYVQNAISQLMTKPPKQKTWGLPFDDGKGSIFQILSSQSKIDAMTFVAVLRIHPETGEADQLIISRDSMPKGATKGFGGKSLQGKIKDGILKIAGIAKEVDLKNFDAELQFFGERIEASDKVEVPVPDSLATAGGPQTVKVDLGDVILNGGFDLVEDARLHPEKYMDLREDAANVEKILQGLKLGQSFVLQGSAQVGQDGKTSAIRDFARKVAFGLIPGIPRTLKLVELTSDVLMSAAQEGQQSLDTVMKGMVGAAKKTGCIFVVENLRFLTMLPTKDGKSQIVDAFDSIRSQIRKGEIIFIGTENTTTAKSELAVLPNFRELFHLISLDAPTAAAREGILAGMVTKRFGRTPSWEVIQAAVQAADAFEPTVSPVDSAFRLLADAMAAQKDLAAELTVAEVTDLAKVRYKVPASLQSRETKAQALAEMDARFAQTIVGRKQAVADVKKFWQRALFPVQNSNLLNAVLLAGARESGKKEILKTSALALGYKPTLIQMADYSSPGAVQTFYLKIAHALDKTPFQLFILEGIEKADMSVQEAVLKILEKRRFLVNTKVEGIETLWESEMREVRFTHAQFAMTTTEGSEFIQNKLVTDGKVSEGALRLELGKIIVEEAHGQIGGESASARVAKLGVHNGILRAATVTSVSLPTREEFIASINFFIDELLKKEGASKKVTFKMVDRAGLIAKLSSYFSPNGHGTVVTYWDSRRLTRVVEDAMVQAQMSQDFAPGATIELHWDKDFDPGMAEIPAYNKYVL